MPADLRPRRYSFAGLLFAIVLTATPVESAAQYVLTSPAGDSLVFEAARLRVMLDTARALYTDLEVDPEVLYSIPTFRGAVREPVREDRPEAAYPWNVVTVTSDSTADAMRLPANLREADRAYYNYVVMRMRVVRNEDPDVPCDSLLALEERVVGSFIDGWILSRTLFGGPAFDPLDELAFAREAGLLRALLAAKNNRQVGVCAAEWAETYPDRLAEYETWRRQAFPRPTEEESAPDEVPDEATDAVEERGTAGPAPEDTTTDPQGR